MAISMNGHSASNSYGYIFGVKELDHRFRGALDNGALIVIAGHPGSGKTTFASTICYANTLKGHRCLYISLQESKDKLFRIMRKFRMFFDDAESKGLLKFVKFPLTLEADEIFNSIAKIVSEYDPSVVVVDSITPVLKAIGSDISRRSYIQNYFYELATNFEKLIVLVVELERGKESTALGDIEFVSDVIIALKHRIERGLLVREMEIRKIRNAPIDVARVHFSISEGHGIEVHMPVLLEEIPGHGVEELELGCSTIQKFAGHIHRGFSIYIEYPADARPVYTPFVPLIAAYINNLKVLVISYRYSEPDMKDLLTRLIKIISDDPNIYEQLNRFLENNIVLRGINPFSMSIPHLSSYELEIINSVNPDVVVFHGIEIPLKTLPSKEYISNLYNQIMELKKQNRIIVRMGSYIDKESSYINSTLSDLVIRYYYDSKGVLHIYIWRRGSRPAILTEEDLVTCINEFRKNLKRI
ncbi:putative circadian clock protein, KaiC [Ignisphaera aggregans DSM 17230]|uniref:Putative circadian clock protein, KaiC n=1 Tax=Ignisphaera aggregans (strain DSM 17230 / JCM 13409 / AQ1.S1) TaxID=583356 RepID=E0SPP2_IGNAA|nr:putative circadian clock protein, KaiC [Ignisphaera aggregans DSM 17230]